MSTILAPLLALFLPQVAHAGLLDTLCATPGVQQMCDDITSTFPHINAMNGVVYVSMVIANYLLILIGAAAVAVIVYAGLILVMDGSEGKIDGAKKMVTYAIIGLVLAILADVLVQYVLGLVSAIAGA